MEDSYSVFTVITIDGHRYTEKSWGGCVLTIGGTWLTFHREDNLLIPTHQVKSIQLDPRTTFTPDTTDPKPADDSAWNLPQNRTEPLTICGHTADGDGLGQWECALYGGHGGHHRDEHGAVFNSNGDYIMGECRSTAHTPSRQHYCRLLDGHDSPHTDSAKTWA